MFKSRARVLVILVCFSFLLLCSTLVFCSQTQNFGGDVDVTYTIPKESKFLTYKLNSAKNGWVVTGYDESLRNGETAIVIPDMHEENGQNLPVTEISQMAFYQKGIFTKLIIGRNISIIGYEAFYECEGLTGHLTFPSSVTSIGGYAFYGCNGYTSLTYPSGARLNDFEGVFESCTGLTNIIFPSDVTEIQASSFINCDGLKNLTIPGTVKIIGSYAFYGCTGLETLTLEDGVTTIKDSAFSGCIALNEVIVDSPTVYKNISNSTSSNGYLTNYIKSGGTIKVFQSADDGSNTYLNNYFTKSTETINGKKYNVYTRK